MRQKEHYFGSDIQPEWTTRPDILEYQILLNQWERAYQNWKKSPTPEHIKKFNQIDSWVKTITLHIRDINSQIE